MKVLRQTIREKPSVNVTPLVDMMFILIIFFLVTTQFQQEERDVQVDLPETQAGKTISTSARTLMVINVRQDGSYVVHGRTVSIDELREMLVETVTTNPNQRVLVRADKRALHGYVAAAMALCKRAGIQRANIAYELPQ